MGRYDRVKLICIFDLPTDTAKEKREYRLFRKGLIEYGFFMMQFSVYVRSCPNREFAKKYIPKIQSIAPESGNIRVFMITEKQYNDMKMIKGMKSHEELLLTDERIIVI